jgi:ATP phosphoribosyltransferase regulatory subunit
VFAPADEDPALLAEIRRLRSAGRRVITGLPGRAEDAAAMGCNEELIKVDGAWRIQFSQSARQG